MRPVPSTVAAGPGGFCADGRGPAELSYLEGLTHPRIRRRLEERVAELSGRNERGQLPGGSDVSAVIVDAPLLVEAGWHRFCDRIVYVEGRVRCVWAAAGNEVGVRRILIVVRHGRNR